MKIHSTFKNIIYFDSKIILIELKKVFTHKIKQNDQHFKTHSSYTWKQFSLQFSSTFFKLFRIITF